MAVTVERVPDELIEPMGSWLVFMPAQVRLLDHEDVVAISLAASCLNVAIQRGIESLEVTLRR